jgi:hypothetical protein
MSPLTESVWQLQRLAGNRAVSSLINMQRAGSDPYDPKKFGPEDDTKVQQIINDTEADHLLPVGRDGKRPYPFFNVKAAAADLKGRRSQEPYDTTWPAQSTTWLLATWRALELACRRLWQWSQARTR